MSRSVLLGALFSSVSIVRRVAKRNLLLLATIFITIIFLNASALYAGAQAADEAGIKPFATLQGGPVEDVNLSNHTINLHPTLLSYPQRGGKLQFNLIINYTNATWQEKETCLPGIPKTCFFDWFPDAGGSAKINVVRSRDLPFFFTEALNTLTNPPEAYFVKLSDGSTHPAGQIGTNLFETLDGTGILLNTSTADITFPDGVRANPNNGIMTDPNGNQITESSSGWMDTMGRNIPSPPGTNGNIAQGGVATTDFSHCTGQLPIDSAALWTVPGPNGGTSTYKFCFVKVHVFTAHWATDDSTHKEENNDDVEIQSIVLPDNTAWTFDYSQPDANGVNWGDLVKITLPTGGSISYVWQTSHGCSVSHVFTDASYRAVTQRIVDANDGSGPQKWTYSLSTVTDPSGNDTVHTFTNLSGCSFYETQTQTYNGSQSAGDLIQTVVTNYSWDPNPNTPDGAFPPAPTAINVVAKVRTTTLANGLVKQTSYAYDPGFTYTSAYGGGTLTGLYGKVTSQIDTDWGQGSPGQPLRETDTQYQFVTDTLGTYKSLNLLETPNSVIVKDGSGNVVAKTTYGYDEVFNGISQQPSGITTHHVSVGPMRGNRSSTTRWLLSSNTPVTSSTFPYDTGEPYQVTDPNLNTTTYSYDPAYAGGFQTMTCRQATGAVKHCVSGTYDFNTGHLLTFTDENAAFQASGTSHGDPAHTITYVYNDPLGRLTSITYPADSAGHQPQTTFNYSLPGVLPVSVQQLRTIVGTTQDDSTTYFDGLGREFKTVHASAGGATVIKTYDSVGRIASVTNPYFSTSDSTYGVTRYEYDALGRMKQTTKQDGSFSTMDYSQGNCVLGKDEAGTELRRCSDGLGRIKEVDEPGPGADIPGVSGTGSINISGSLASSTSSGTKATGWFTVNGSEAVYFQPKHCVPDLNSGLEDCSGPSTTYDSGSVSVTVNGFTSSANYFSGSTAAGLASALAAGFNVAGSPVSASYPGSGSTVTLTAKQPGPDYALSQSSFTNNVATFGAASFSSALSGSALAGGIFPVTTFDSGKLTVTVDGFTASASYNQSLNNSAANLTTALISALNAAASPVTASPSGSTSITLTAKSVGVGTDYTVTGSSTASFTVSGATLGSGKDGTGIYGPYVTLYTHDALGNLTCVEQHGDASSGTGCSSPASSDATSPWRVRRFAYDSLSRLISSSNPETNTFLSATGSDVVGIQRLFSPTRSNTVYQYDNNGNLLQKTSPAPNQVENSTQTISYCYDALNRVTGKAYSAQTCQDGQLPTGTAAATYTYDQGANGIGQRTGMTDASGSSLWTYDALGRMLTWRRTTGSATRSIGYSYNLDNSLASITYPSGAVITYAPDAAGRPLSAVDTGNNINYVTNVVYDAPSFPTSFASGSGVSSTFTYNKRLQPITITAATSSQTLLNLTYDFHEGSGNNGNVWAVTNGKDATRSLTFTYDQLNRLTSAQNAGTDCTTMTVNGKTEYWGNSYGYDPWGNLTQKSVTKCSAENLSISASGSNQLNGYSYDAAGSMTSDLSDGVSVTYDAENRIASVSQGGVTTTYAYDGDGNRVEKSSGGTGTLYWSGLPGVLAESDLSGTIQSEYVFFNGQRVARRDEASQTGVYYYFSDFLKSASLVTDAAGNIKAESDYYPWGGELQMTNSDSNHFKFTGKERDAESGLDYFGARFYSAALGRFMSPDWSQAPSPVPYADLSDPQTLNLYSYVRNSPVAHFDADGHFRTSIGGASGGACADGTSDCQTDQMMVAGQDQVSYYQKTETTKQNEDGTTTVTTKVTWVTLSSKKGHEGEFLRAKQSTSSVTRNQHGDIVSKTPFSRNNLNFKQAVGAIGASAYSELGARAAGNWADHFPTVMADYVKEHPFTSAAAATSVFDGFGLLGTAPKLADASKFIWDALTFAGAELLEH